MATRRRSRRRRRLLDDFADQSPVHAFAAGLLRFGLRAGLALLFFLIVMNVLVPNMVDGLVENFHEQMRR